MFAWRFEVVVIYTTLDSLVCSQCMQVAVQFSAWRRCASAFPAHHIEPLPAAAFSPQRTESMTPCCMTRLLIDRRMRTDAVSAFGASASSVHPRPHASR